MNTYFSRARRILLTAAASLLLTRCSGLDSVFGPSDQPFTIDQGSFTLSPDQVRVGAFTTTESGSLAVTVDWGSVDNRIALELYRGTCTVTDIQADRLTGTCSGETRLAKADESLVKRNVLVVPNLASGTYTLVIEYRGDGSQTTETGTFSIILSPPGDAPADGSGVK